MISFNYLGGLSLCLFNYYVIQNARIAERRDEYRIEGWLLRIVIFKRMNKFRICLNLMDNAILIDNHNCRWL